MAKMLKTPRLSGLLFRFQDERPLPEAMKDFNNNGIEPLSVPGFGLRIDASPFEDTLEVRGAFRHGSNDHCSHQRLTVRELAMLQFMNAITDKHDWHIKINDEQIVQRWKKEALKQSDGLINDTIFAWLTAELQDKAAEFAKTGFIKAIDTESRVVKSDTIVDETLRKALSTAARDLASRLRPDWHPNTDEKVLNLVHPSLYPLVYGKTRALPSGQTALEWPFVNDLITEATNGDQEVDKERPGTGYIPQVQNSGLWSIRFQWLPCDVDFSTDSGTEVKIKSYINNLHPVQHRPLYDMVEKLICKSIPLWNDILFRGYGGRTKLRIHTNTAEFDPPRPETDEWPWEWDEEDSEKNQGMVKKVEEYLAQPDNPIWGLPDEDGGHFTVPKDWKERLYTKPEYWQSKWSPFQIADTKWFRCRKLIHPMPDSTYEAWKGDDTAAVQLENEFRHRGLQVIVKLASVELTPEKPKYEGGSWHLEGMQNEHIVATSIYYYDVKNITPSRIRFRQNADLDTMSMDYEQDDHAPLAKVFGVESDSLRDEPATQEIGSLETREGRMIAFPNTLHHCVEPFELKDKSKPGHRRFLLVWLCDPHYRLMSTANVPPQQRDWWEEEKLSAINPEDRGIVQNLMTLDEAKEYRLELMEERTRYIETVDGNTDTYNFCEH